MERIRVVGSNSFFRHVVSSYLRSLSESISVWPACNAKDEMVGLKTHSHSSGIKCGMVSNHRLIALGLHSSLSHLCAAGARYSCNFHYGWFKLWFLFLSIGARCVSTLLNEMKHRGKDCRFGVISMCIGTGMGAAAVFERGDVVDQLNNARRIQSNNLLSKDAM